MQNIDSVEQAYQALGSYIVSFIKNRKWDMAACEIQTWPGCTGLKCWLSYNGVKDKKGGSDEELDDIALAAATYLHDNMLKTTGNQIWAMTALLYPNNEIKITYDYDKPKEYDELSKIKEPVNVFESIERLNAAGAHFGGVTETRPKDKDGK